MIKHYLLTGDTHSRVLDRLNQLKDYKPAETALIILGDAGLNFYLNKTDYKNKKLINNTGYTIYCLRGNHEERPENISNMLIMLDPEVNGMVYVEPEFMNIRYLMDGHCYKFGQYTALCIGGAYSVDKWYRLNNYKQSNGWCGWFPEEQLTDYEMQFIEKRMSGNYYDFIFTHTCPHSWEPKDLFIEGLDQSTVDKSMEYWLDDFKEKISFNIWCFGHYHSDRTEYEGVEQYYQDIEPLEAIWDRTLNHISRNS